MNSRNPAMCVYSIQDYAENLFKTSSLLFILEERWLIILKFFNTVFYVAERSMTQNFRWCLCKRSWTPASENEQKWMLILKKIIILFKISGTWSLLHCVLCYTLIHSKALYQMTLRPAKWGGTWLQQYWGHSKKLLLTLDMKHNCTQAAPKAPKILMI
jgi:hypothetical protein